jgi:hypothetical protein
VNHRRCVLLCKKPHPDLEEHMTYTQAGRDRWEGGGVAALRTMTLIVKCGRPLTSILKVWSNARVT